MARTKAAKKQPADPFGKLADAIDLAAESGKTPPISSRPSPNDAPPNMSEVARIVFSGSYAVSFAVTFPALMFARSISANNPLSQGIADGARDAHAKAEAIKKPPDPASGGH